MLEGPTDEPSDEIPPGGTGSLKVELEEGDYEVTAGERRGARRRSSRSVPSAQSSQNELLLP